jgi:hypothetical protein
MGYLLVSEWDSHGLVFIIRLEHVIIADFKNGFEWIMPIIHLGHDVINDVAGCTLSRGKDL